MNSMSPIKIREKGYKALFDALGPIGMLEFLQQFDLGSGDYTKERRKWVEKETLDSVLAEVEEFKKEKK